MSCTICMGWAELLDAGWIGALVGEAVMAMAAMAGDRRAARERDEG